MKRTLFRSGSAMLAFVVVFALSGCGLRQTDTTYKINLEIWGAFDDSDAYQDIFGKYHEINPYIGQITYRKFPVDSYRQDLLDALAAGNGPDIFLIRNGWTPSFSDKVIAAPADMIDERSYRDAFVDVAADDFVRDGSILGVPLSVDSLALYYNKDLLGAAGITAPPKTWEQLLADAQLLRRIDEFGNITVSGIALGTAENINRSTDVLNALFLQKGVTLPLTRSENLRLSNAAGVSALQFYTQFSNPLSAVYSWNPRMHYSIDSFYEGTAAMMINYSWHYDTIKRKNAKLNFAVAPLPQFEGTQPYNFPGYWGFVVAKNKQAPEGTTDTAVYEKAREHEAWEFLKYMTFPNNGTVTLKNAITGNTKDFSVSFDPADAYLEKTKQPAARRDLAAKQHTDPQLGPFADGNLIARDWYQADPESVESILANAITSVNFGSSSVQQSLSIAENRINQLKAKW